MLWKWNCEHYNVGMMVWKKCEHDVVRNKWWQRSCEKDIVTKTLWERRCVKDVVRKTLWERRCEKNLMRKVLWEIRWARHFEKEGVRRCRTVVIFSCYLNHATVFVCALHQDMKVRLGSAPPTMACYTYFRLYQLPVEHMFTLEFTLDFRIDFQ